MGKKAMLKDMLIGRALEKAADPFEEGRITVLLNFSIFMFLTNLPYTVITFNDNPASLNFLSAIIQDLATLAVIITLNRGYSISTGRNIFFANFFIQNLYHFIVNNGTSGILAQGMLFFLLIIMFGFFLFGNGMGWTMFLVMSVMVGVGFLNENSNYSLFRVSEKYADPMAAKEMSFLIILPLGMNVYLLSEFVKAQNKAKKRINSQNTLLSQKNQEITDSINYARKIQEAILPSKILFESLLKDAFVIYKPKDIVAGDFYFLDKVEERIIVAVADCTGHGVPGAMMSVACSNSLKRSVKEFDLVDSGRILDKTRELIIESLSSHEAGIKDGMDISLLVLDLKNKSLNWSGANNPLVIIRDNQLTEYKGDKQPVGNHIKQTVFTTHTIELHENDCLYFFSDGFQDQFGGPKQKKFSSKALRRILLGQHQQSMQKQKEGLEEEFSKWKGELDQVDDVCLIGINVH